ncbi:MAG: site-specific DNA-methyltransferase, partial [Candidatus ainarchaeum sp.]|nr:site-specific DNA-methyltransferase [Candidatus ainarchaeum sp.]
MEVKKESEDVLNNKIKGLKDLLPEIFTENKIDFDKFKQFFKEDISKTNEKYSLNWVGKSESIKNIQTNSKLTLVPDKEGSINFDLTKNIFIEGDNLEVLKLLNKSYFGKIKLIYIDP